MTVVALGFGEYKVYSGTRESYVVDLITETCECPDEEYNHPAEGCKHRQRAEMATGQRQIPDLGPHKLDVEVTSGRRAGEAELVTDGGTAASSPEPRESSAEDSPAHAAGCRNPECEGLSAGDRPLLSFECWAEWAAFDESDYWLDDEGGAA